MTIQARYSGTCPACGGRWQPGDLIRAHASSRVAVWGHVVCPDDDLAAALAMRPGEFVCQTCWLVHPEGVCDR